MDPDKGLMEFKGRSVHENINGFYDDIKKWVTEYRRNPQEITRTHFYFEYLNSASFRAIRDIVLLLGLIEEEGKTLIIYWEYETGDSSMREMGDLLNDQIQTEFVFVENDE